MMSDSGHFTSGLPVHCIQCSEVREVLPWWLDDELDAELCLALEAHLDVCGYCTTFASSERRLRAVVSGALRSEMSMPASLKREVMGDICARTKRQRAVWPGFIPALAATGVLLGLVFLHHVRDASDGRFFYTYQAAPELRAALLAHKQNLPMDVDAYPEPVSSELQQTIHQKVVTFLQRKLPVTINTPNMPFAEHIGGQMVRLNNRRAAHLRFDTPRGRFSFFAYPKSSWREIQQKVVAMRRMKNSAMRQKQAAQELVVQSKEQEVLQFKSVQTKVGDTSAELEAAALVLNNTNIEAEETRPSKAPTWEEVVAKLEAEQEPWAATDSRDRSLLFRIDDRSVRLHRVSGYSAAEWQDALMNYSVVSDLPPRELPEVIRTQFIVH